MYRCGAHFVLGLLVLSCVSTGCRGRFGGGDGEGNQNDNGSPSTDDLTPQQKAAVDAVVEQLEAATRGLAATVDGIEGIDFIGDGSVGECPIVTTVRDGGVIGVTADYGTGCTNDYYGSSVLSGSVLLNYNLATQAVAVSYNDFSFDGTTVDGAFILQLTRGEDNRRVLAGQVDLTTTGVGSAVGDMTLQFDLLDDTITIVQADLTLTETGGDPYVVAMDGLVMRPISNGNFVPQSGTLAFEIPNTGPGPATVTVVITYDESSPMDGTVSVKIGAAPPVEYDLPGV